VKQATFEVDVTAESALQFAAVSGDWNPLHTDPTHAARTAYQRPVLHGAYSAGLVSRMAGMYLPGTDCLLHGVRLRFIKPVVPPARLVVSGKVVSERGDVGTVEVAITDAASGVRYVDASYDFGRHDIHDSTVESSAFASASPATDEPVVLVTGASGGIGQAIMARLGERGLGISRSDRPGLLRIADLESAQEAIGDARLSAIVHCAWPAPDNTRLTELADPGAPIEHYISHPVRDMIRLAQLLRARGTADAMLLLIGSTAASPGRHNYRMPLYTLGKSLVPELTRILALELGTSGGQRCVSIVYDVIDAGMNQQLSRAARLAHANRSPSGSLPDAAEAAAQVLWVLENRSFLVSGSVIELTGGALP